MTENYDTLKRSSEEGHGTLQAKTAGKNEEPVSVVTSTGWHCWYTDWTYLLSGTSV